MRLNDAITCYLRHLAANGCSIHTIRSYRFDLGALCRFLGARGHDVASMAPADLDAFLTSPVALTRPDGQPRSPGTVNRTRATLRSFFNYLRETGVTGTNPARTLKVRSLDPPPPTTLDKREERKLLGALRGSDDALAPRDRTILGVLLGTGIRIGEAVSLDVEDLDLRTRTLAVRTKGNGRQIRHLTDHLTKELREYLCWRKALANGLPALFISLSSRAMVWRWTPKIPATSCCV